jgi:MoaA/NifB/PqqE/SkfB family radical SAM enzyme
MPRTPLSLLRSAYRRVRVHTRSLASHLRRDIERTVTARYQPTKPHVVNMLANDICNSQCTMCLIWEQKRDKELTPEELRTILRDPLFSEVRHVGVTGGEPTLRPDLPDLYEALCQELPDLKGASGITNAINKEQVIDRLTRSAAVCHAHDTSFSFMVSLDGVGAIHDQNRGVEGNFETAIEVIEHFKTHTDIPVAAGCTITKHNAWHVDELLEFCQRHDIYIRFRVAEYITRLYNSEQSDVIRNFSEDEAYHLALFFERLRRRYEPNAKYRRTYASIHGMLLGQPRAIGCPYQSHGVVLDSQGNLQYCAPKSKVIGNALETSAMKAYTDHLDERRRIQDEECADCIHDYHAPPTTQEVLHAYREKLWKKTFSFEQGVRAAEFASR